MKYCYGVDIGGTSIKMGFFQEDGKLLGKWEIDTKTENKGRSILPDAAEAIYSYMKKNDIVSEDILGVGVGIPGPVNDEGIVLSTANLGWGYKDVVKEFEELLHMPVKAGNDANMAALGEMWRGGGVGHKNMLLITLGTGVGGGIIIDGHAVVGHHGAAGEIGHMTVNQSESIVCGCGRKGCLEQYASATGIERLARRRLEEDTKASALRSQKVNAKTVFDAVKAGDMLAMEVAEEFASYLGYAVANICVITDPSMVVIGGGVSRAGEILIEYVERYFKKAVFFANENTHFGLATLGNDAGIYGCAKLILGKHPTIK